MYSIKSFLLIFLAFLLTQCQEKTLDTAPREKTKSIESMASVVIDSMVVLKKDLILDQLKGIWSYKNQPFNGFSTKYYPNGILEEKLGFYNGKRQGIAKRWSDKGVLRVESNYNQNKLVGSYKTWWENGTLAEESIYDNGLLQGEQKQWYANAQLAKLRNLDKGNEDGMQKAWLKNGTLYVNYEAKNGRVFGLMRSNLCYELKNEVVTR